MNINQFEKQKFMCIETFRKNGQGVKTPVWFVQDGEKLVIWTPEDSGKAKRIRKNEMVRIVPSTSSGEPVGEWVEAQARVDDSSEAVSHAVNLFKQKYGFMFSLFMMLAKIRKSQFAAIKIDIV